MKAQNRLTKKEQFQEVFTYGRKFRNNGLAVVVWENKQKYTRIGFIVGKKLFAQAVVRNQLRRKLRELAGKMIKKGILEKGKDLVLIVADAAYQQKTSADISRDLEILFKKSDVIKN